MHDGKQRFLATYKQISRIEGVVDALYQREARCDNHVACKVLGELRSQIADRRHVLGCALGEEEALMIEPYKTSALGEIA